MSIKTKRLSAVGIVILAALGAFIFLYQPGRPNEAHADDSYRTTTLSISGGVATATLSDTYTSDDLWVITWYHTPSGGAETVYSEIESSKTAGWVAPNADSTLETSAFSSNDTLRARFRTYLGDGTNTMDYSRSVTVP